MGDGQAAQTGAPGQLWYCAKCTRMISPPGAEGFVTPEGEHLCPNCAPSRRTSSLRLKALDAPKSGSKPTLKAVQAVTPPAAGTKSSAVRSAVGRSDQKPFPVAMAVGGGVVVVFLALVLFSSRTPPRQTGISAPLRQTGMSALPPAAADKTVRPTGASDAAAAAAAAKPSEALRADPRIQGPAFLQAGDKKPAESVEAKPAVAAAPAAGDDGQQAFAEELKKAGQSDEQGRHGLALQQLKELSKRFAAAPWWETRKEQVSKAEQLAQQRLAEYGAEAEDERKRVRESDKPEFLSKTEAAWKARLENLTAGGQPADEAAAQPARQVLKDISARRAQLAEQKRQAALTAVTQQLEGLEKQLKSPTNREAARKTLNDIEALIADGGLLETNLAERLAGLRFDLALSHEADLAFYKAPVKPVLGGVEIPFDFLSADQFSVWTADQEGDASVDTQKGAILLRHLADKRNKRDDRMVRLPFECFRPAQWAIEVEATLNSNKNKLEYGMQVFDGTGNWVRLTVRQGTVKDLSANLSGAVPGRGGLKQRARLFAGNTRDSVRLRMVCQQGVVSASSVDLANNRSGVHDPETLGFEPRFLSLFIHVHDREEESSAVFSKLKLSGVLALDRLRRAACAAARKEAETNLGLFKDWLILGPFKNEQPSPWEKGGAPRGTLDTAALLKLPPANKPAWQRPFSPAAFGPVDLAALLKPNEDVYAYAAAEIRADQDAEGLLLLGSDDGVVVWLDGVEIHRHPEPRGVKADDDKVPVRLSVGTHTLVFRVDQGKGEWGFCARLAAADGKSPLAGAQLRCPEAK